MSDVNTSASSHHSSSHHGKPHQSGHKAPVELAPQQTPIAVVGVSALFPGSAEAGGFWKDILAGRDLITEVPETHWLPEDYFDPEPGTADKTYAKRGAFLQPIDFDPLAYGVPPNNLSATDTAQLLALVVAQQVLEDACGSQFEKVDKSRTSVILGVTSALELLVQAGSRLQRPVWLKAMRDAGMSEDEAQKIAERIANYYVPWQENTFPGLLGNVVAGRIANRFNLGGTNCVTDAACASTFAAVQMAVSELRLKESDLVITGGVDTFNDIFMYMCFSKTPALSASGEARPFCESADGTLLGEGLGMVALKRLEDAERDGDRIYAVLRGIGSSSDGRAKSVYAPLPAGQARALTRAYEQAGYDPMTVELVEAHGTGTKAGDVAEFEGLRQAFTMNSNGHRHWCALGSVKSQIGHTKAAAGAAGLFKMVMALHHKVLPPTIKVDRPNPKLAMDKSPFYINSTARPWIKNGGPPRRAGVSSFGFGGSNFHIALEEYRGPSPAARFRSSPTELVVLTGASREELAAKARETVGEAQERGALIRLAYRSQDGAAASEPWRMAIVAGNEEELIQRLETAAARLESEESASDIRLPDVYVGSGEAPANGVGLLFPGQGSQYAGMGGHLAMTFDAARQVWETTAALKLGGLEYLHDVVFPIPAFDEDGLRRQEDKLRDTRWAQPAIGAASLAGWELLQAVGCPVSCAAGHSYGEITALAAAGALSREDMLRIARRRGELMASASDIDGGMLAVKASADELREILAAEPWGSDLVLANFNAPRQSVLSGPVDAIERAAESLEPRGLKPRRLPVATAFHSPLVAEASRPFGSFLEGIAVGDASFDVYQNATAASYAGGGESVRSGLAEQIAMPVRFVEIIEAMYARGVRTFVEAGPGSVLTGLVGSILEGRPHLAVSLDRKGRHGLTSLWHALGELTAAGHTLNLRALWDGFAAPEDPREQHKPRLAVSVQGSNYGKLYPPAGEQEMEGVVMSERQPSPPAAAPVAPAPAAPASVAPVPAAPMLMASPPSHEAAGGGPAGAPPAGAPPAGAPPAGAPPAGAPPAGGGGNPPGDDDPKAPAAVQLAWIDAYQQAQRQVVETHAAFQQAMAQTQQSFLRTVETSFAGLNSVISGETPPAMPPQAVPAQPAAPVMPQPAAPAMPAPMPAPQPAPAPMPVAAPAPAPAAAPAPMPVAAPMPAPAPVPVAPAPAIAAEPAPPAAATPDATTEAAPDVDGLLLAVVADKTGYPAEMLHLEMDLEADLGVDSIKRVEILSAVREREPRLPEVDTAQMGQLRTLGQIVEYLGVAGEANAAAAATAAPATQEAAAVEEAPAAEAPVEEAAEIHLDGLLLDVVADKTGYPADMLQLTMDLEADLGVDSIKRVEILSAMRDREPRLPEVDTAQMGQLRTLGQIVEYMRVSPEADAEVAEEPEPAAASEPAEPSEPEALEAAPESTEVEEAAEPAEVEEAVAEAVVADEAVVAEEAVEASEPDAAEPDAAEAAEEAVQPSEPETSAFRKTHGRHSRPIEPVVGRFALHEVPAEPVGLAIPGLGTSSLIAITDDGGGIAVALAEQLMARGVATEVVTEVPEDASGVIFLGGLTEVNNVSDALAVNRAAFRAAKRVAGHLTTERGLFITVQDTGGDFGLSGAGDAAALGGLAGLTKTAAQEWPAVEAKAIDLERGDRPAWMLAKVLAKEIFEGGPELEVGLHADGRRTTLESYLAMLNMGESGSPFSVVNQSVLQQSSVIVASGGARGVTAATLIALARNARPRLVLLGRTPLIDEPEACQGVEDEAELKRILFEAARESGDTPTPAEIGDEVRRILSMREVRHNLETLHQAGSEVRYLPIDVQDREAMSAALDEVRNDWGPITGLVHGAGVLADKLIVEKTEEQFDRVFNTKVEGLLSLLEVTKDDPLSLIVLFSSVAGRNGNRGQADYAMANEILNKIASAERQRREGCLVKSLNWGPWEGGMVTSALKEHFEAQGVPLISLDVGSRLLVEEIHANIPDQVEVVLGGAPWRRPLQADAQRAQAELSMDAFVSATTHPYLDSHVIEDVPVLPTMLVLEWFARITRAHCPDLELKEMRDLKVLRGLRLEGFYEGGDAFTVHSEVDLQPTGRCLNLELLDREGRRRFSAVAVLGQPAAAVTASASTMQMLHTSQTVELRDAPEKVYDGRVLFHARDFQVIREVEGFYDEGLIAKLGGTREMGWSDNWQTDVAILDGGLQMALLWFARVLGGASLPTAVRVYQTHFSGPIDGPVRAVLQSRKTGSHYVTCDVAFLNDNGTLVAELRGIDVHARLPQRRPEPASETANEPPPELFGVRPPEDDEAEDGISEEEASLLFYEPRGTARRTGETDELVPIREQDLGDIEVSMESDEEDGAAAEEVGEVVEMEIEEAPDLSADETDQLFYESDVPPELEAVGKTAEVEVELDAEPELPEAESGVAAEEALDEEVVVEDVVPEEEVTDSGEAANEEAAADEDPADEDAAAEEVVAEAVAEDDAAGLETAPIVDAEPFPDLAVETDADTDVDEGLLPPIPANATVEPAGELQPVPELLVPEVESPQSAEETEGETATSSESVEEPANRGA